MANDRLERLERYCVDLAAELECLRSALQVFPAVLLQSVASKSELFAGWRKAVIDRAEKQVRLSPDEENRRAAELVLHNLRMFFDEMAAEFGHPPPTTGESQ
jgi:hypothetical protein